MVGRHLLKGAILPGGSVRIGKPVAETIGFPFFCSLTHVSACCRFAKKKSLVIRPEMVQHVAPLFVKVRDRLLLKKKSPARTYDKGGLLISAFRQVTPGAARLNEWWSQKNAPLPRPEKEREKKKRQRGTRTVQSLSADGSRLDPGFWPNSHTHTRADPLPSPRRTRTRGAAAAIRMRLIIHAAGSRSPVV